MDCHDFRVIVSIYIFTSLLFFKLYFCMEYARHYSFYSSRSTVERTPKQQLMVQPIWFRDQRCELTEQYLCSLAKSSGKNLNKIDRVHNNSSAKILPTVSFYRTIKPIAIFSYTWLNNSLGYSKLFHETRQHFWDFYWSGLKDKMTLF